MRRMRSVAGALAMLGALACVVVGTARAEGSCGRDPDANRACPVRANSTVSGSLANRTEHDYYVFYVAHRTRLTLTVNDTEDPTCSVAPYDPQPCGGVDETLLDASGNMIADSGPLSLPNNGVPVPVTVTRTVARGIYYAVVSGYEPPLHAHVIPYALTVDGHPGVRWPVHPRRHRAVHRRRRHRVRRHRVHVRVHHHR